MIGIAAALLVRLLPTVRLQLIGLTFLAVALPLGAVLASGWVMFHMHDDVKILAVSAASALSAVIGALLVAHWIVKPIDELRVASRKLAGGELSARAPQLERPTELQELAASFNEMATNIEDVFDARRQLVAWASHDLRTPSQRFKQCSRQSRTGWRHPTSTSLRSQNRSAGSPYSSTTSSNSPASTLVRSLSNCNRYNPATLSTRACARSMPKHVHATSASRPPSTRPRRRSRPHPRRSSACS